MSKLNPKNQQATTVFQVAAKHDLTLGVSANGNIQFNKEPLQLLYELAVSTLFGKGTFYKSSDNLVQELRKSVREAVKMDAFDYVANLAIHARGEMNIRTIPIVLVVEFAAALREQNKSYPHLRQLVCDVVQRADQINDMYAYSLDVFGDKKSVPMAIKRGVADAFNKFSSYNFAKYNRGDAVKFRDVLRIVHPTAKNEKQGEIFKKIMEDSLEVPYTWETQLSSNGQLPVEEQKSKKELWTELYLSGQMGFMAQLRNMRNLVQSGADPKTLTQVAAFLSDPEQVTNSKQLIFDFVEAYKIIQPLDSKLATAVSKAIDLSVVNTPKIGERIWIIIDYSGSMGNNDSIAINTSTLLAAALLKANESADNLAVTMFGDKAKTIRGIDTNNSILGIQKELLTHRTGAIAGYTNFGAALSEKSSLGFEPDTVIVFTDGEINRFPYNTLRQATGNHKVVKLAIDMNSSSTTPLVQQEGWYSVAGWSSAMFKWVDAIRNKSSAVDQLSGPYKGVK